MNNTLFFYAPVYMAMLASSEVQLAPKAMMRDTYKHSLVFPVTGSQTATLTATNNHETIFEIPSKAINLGQSYLSFAVQVTGAANTAVAFFARGANWLSRASLYTRSGVYLADVSHADKWVSMSMAQTSMSDRMSYGAGVGTSNGSLELGSTGHIQSGGTEIDHVAGTFVPVERQLSVRNATNIVASFDTAGTTFEPTFGITDSPHVIMGSQSQSLSVNIRFPLAAIRDTILSADKSIYFPEVLLLRITWNPCSHFAYRIAAPNPAIALSATVSTVSQVTTASVVNIGLHLAVSQDPNVVSDLINRVMNKGMSMDVPFVYMSEHAADQQNQSVSLRVGSGFGKSLLSVISSVYAGDHSALRHVCGNNQTGELVEQYYTALDSQRLNDADLRTGDGSAYMENARLLEGSAYSGSTDWLQSGAPHIDSFRAGKCIEWPERIFVSDGLNIQNSERTFTFFAVCPSIAGSNNRYTYIGMSVQKELTLGAQGISFV